jgi:hypothetical protein
MPRTAEVRVQNQYRLKAGKRQWYISTYILKPLRLLFFINHTTLRLCHLVRRHLRFMVLDLVQDKWCGNEHRPREQTPIQEELMRRSDTQSIDTKTDGLAS